MLQLKPDDMLISCVPHHSCLLCVFWPKVQALLCDSGREAAAEGQRRTQANEINS